MKNETVFFGCDFKGTYRTEARCEVPADVVAKGSKAIKTWLANNEHEWQYLEDGEIVDTDEMCGMPYGLEVDGVQIEDMHNGD